jgi:hypothetical protein
MSRFVDVRDEQGRSWLLNADHVQAVLIQKDRTGPGTVLSIVIAGQPNDIVWRGPDEMATDLLIKIGRAA